MVARFDHRLCPIDRQRQSMSWQSANASFRHDILTICLLCDILWAKIAREPQCMPIGRRGLLKR
jgi:hypothetical protein